ncbi:MAG: hypothetical protein HZA00_06990 [Nitrospinae bacterium]|nr:hypothetical protein [Nitrospinota bacterium]
MKKFRFIILLLIPLLILNQTAFAVSIPEPEVMSTPEKDIPVEKIEEKKSINTWLWVLLGAAVVGGIAFLLSASQVLHFIVELA